ncbi:hypothetical protein Nmel_005376 [Mimus melanotis]
MKCPDKSSTAERHLQPNSITRRWKTDTSPFTLLVLRMESQYMGFNNLFGLWFVFLFKANIAKEKRFSSSTSKKTGDKRAECC